MPVMPNVELVTTTFKTLLRRGVKVSVINAPFTCGTPVVGIYRSGDGRCVAACLADITFSAYSAAAFSAIPCRVAEESIKAGVLDENLEDIFGEVLNVISRLFMASETQRISLLSKSFPPQIVPDNVMAASQVLDLSIEIDGYGDGRLSLLLL